MEVAFPAADVGDLDLDEVGAEVPLWNTGGWGVDVVEGFGAVGGVGVEFEGRSDRAAGNIGGVGEFEGLLLGVRGGCGGGCGG